MTLVNAETGEIVEPLDRTEAERLTTRIRLRLDTIADNYTAVMPLIREAIERQAYAALGYVGVSEYVSECFGDALSKLDIGMRREVVRELTAAGMSTRAIAPVVGVSHEQVRKDQGVNQLTPVPTPEPEAAPDFRPVDPTEGRGEGAVDTPPAPVNGLDGKTYTRPAKPKRAPLTDAAANAGWDLRKSVERLQRIAEDDRFNANKEAVAPHLRGHLTDAIEVLADLLERINN